MTYEEWVMAEAAKINSDGCTAVAEWNRQCCFEHDLACHHAKDPRKAFEVGWSNAPAMSRRNADFRFWRCNRAASPTFLGRIRAFIRYIGVRIGAIFT